MAIRVDDFVSEMNRGGMVKTNKFWVKIFPPNIVVNSFDGDVRERLNTGIPLRTQRVTLPPRQMKTIMQKSAYREMRPIPVGYNSLDDLNMQVVLSGDLLEKRAVMRWQNKIFNDGGVPAYIDNVSGKMEIHTEADNFGFKEVATNLTDETNAFEYVPPGGDYAVTNERESVYTCHIFDECWPMMVGDIELSHDSSEFAVMNIVWQYRSWYMKPITIKEKMERRKYDGWRNAAGGSQIGVGVGSTSEKIQQAIVGNTGYAKSPNTTCPDQYGQ